MSLASEATTLLVERPNRKLLVQLEAVLRTHQTQRRALAWRERAELQSVR